jgi:hypothetical protein
MVRRLKTAKARGRAVQHVDEQLAQQRAFVALRLMRNHGLSLARAAHEAGTTSRSVLKRVKLALRKTADGEWMARASDPYPRPLWFITPTKRIVVWVNPRVASRISHHANAVDRFLRTGETDALDPYRGRFIRVGGVRHRFVTDPRVLTRLGNAGEIAFEDLYAVTI